jgi:hypothetical protein
MNTAKALAAVIYQTGFRIDAFLATIACSLRAEGFKLAGTIQENASGAETSCSAMTLVDLASNVRFAISQDLGSAALGCRLDPRGLAEAESPLAATLDTGPDLVILNKFGKAEAEGGGLRNTFIRAIETGIPILTAARPPYTEAWNRFHGGLAVDLPPDFDTVRSWCRSAATSTEDRQRPLAETA